MLQFWVKSVRPVGRIIFDRLGLSQQAHFITEQLTIKSTEIMRIYVDDQFKCGRAFEREHSGRNDELHKASIPA